MAYIVIDSGTTTTRVRLWHEGGVRWTGSRPVGARDTALTGDTSRLRDSLRDMIAQLQREVRVSPEAAICSGMITSNMGLLEIPHVRAPASPGDLAEALVRHDFPDIANLPFYFVPGVKTLPDTLALEAMAEADVMRGEEAECVGLRDLLKLTGAAVFLHFGSHHKAIFTAAEGSIIGSRTAITGELLSAIAEHTILKSSTVALADLDLSEAFWRAGVRAAQQHGLARALFLVRLGEQLGNESKAAMTSFLLGILASGDMRLLKRDSSIPVVVYGTGAFPAMVARLLEEGSYEVIRADAQTAELSAVRGAVILYELHRQLRKRPR